MFLDRLTSSCVIYRVLRVTVEMLDQKDQKVKRERSLEQKVNQDKKVNRVVMVCEVIMVNLELLVPMVIQDQLDQLDHLAKRLSFCRSHIQL